MAHSPFDPPVAYVIRHGETTANADNCYRGWGDYPLNEEGHDAAALIQNFLSYTRLGRVVCSDLTRAKQTAEYVMNSGVVMCPYISPDFNLRPWGIGGFAGKEKNAANVAKLQRYIDNPDMKIPDAESLNDFRYRASDAIMSYISSPCEGLPTVIVTHTSNITTLYQDINESEDKSPEVHDVVSPGGIVAIFLDTDGNMEMEPVLGEEVVETSPEAS